MISINQRAAAIAHQMAEESEALGLMVVILSNGCTVIDAGVNVSGSLEAGRLFAEACLGGLGQVSMTRLNFEDPNHSAFWLPSVSVSVSYPHIACMAGQYAGWAIKGEKFFAMGSGPARALYAGEEIFAKLDYKDQADVAVLLLEGRQLPGEDVANNIASKCGVSASSLTLIIAPTASLVGSMQIAARVVETGLHKLFELGFDIRKVVSGYGVCPLATIAKDDLRAIGRTNDGVLYGSQVYYTVNTSDEELEKMVPQVPSSASRDYGTPFYDLFQRYGGDFYKIDPLLFSPAQVIFNNLASGHCFTAGQLNSEVLYKSLLAG
ncbi:MAG TPA: methenyltetrahydromethanopterin cyclohydrolase [Anaerolineaceae bacterium]|nr:methenyltetrahydromethanopterin cyclohydrolase [Anaerolineaceae bacterium]